MKLMPLYVKIPENLMAALRQKMATERRTLKEVVVQALKQYLGMEKVN